MSQRSVGSDGEVAGWVRAGWGVDVAGVRPVGGGYDRLARTYEVEGGDGRRYFAKVRQGAALDRVAVELPRHLRRCGIGQVVAAIDTVERTGRYRVGGHEVTLYPFVAGRQAAEGPLTDAQWTEYGAFLGALHAADLPSDLAGLLAEETFSSEAPAVVRAVAGHVRGGWFDDPCRRDLAAFWWEHDDEIAGLTDRLERLAAAARAQRLPHVPCHADVHGWNVLVSDDDGRLHVVDWDGPMLAPRERDLMFVVPAALSWTPMAEGQEEMFWRGYGRAEVNWTAMAYYRYLRVVEDVGEYARGVLFRDDLDEDARAEELRMFLRLFTPGGSAEQARAADRDLAAGGRHAGTS